MPDPASLLFALHYVTFADEFTCNAIRSVAKCGASSCDTFFLKTVWGHVTESKSNRFLKYFPLLIEALRSTDPTAMRPAEAMAWIRGKTDVPEDDLTRHILNGRQSIFENDVHWARFYLVKAGLITKLQRGLWGLTPAGRTVQLTSDAISDTYIRVRDANRPGNSKSEENMPAPADDEGEDERSNWFVGANWDGDQDQTTRFCQATPGFDPPGDIWN